MKQSKTHPARRRLAERGDAEARFSLDINTGSEKLRPEDLLQREAPASIADAQVRARGWRRDNWFVEQVCLKRQDFYNHGLEIAPVEKGKAARVRLEKYLKDTGRRAALLRYISDVWSEYLLQDTVVSFWRRQQEMTPFLLLPEKCEYSDAMGVEILKYKPGCKKQQLEGNDANGIDGLNPAQVKRYTGHNAIVLSREHDEYYRVLTRGLRGEGFGWPRLRTVFRTCSQQESMEVGESMLALAGRMVMRFHKIGFEVRSGANAMRQEAFLWKKKRSDEILKFFKGHSGGFVETTGQFDHHIEYVWVDAKHYDARKWDTIIQRLMWWGGPLACMLMAKTPNPFLLPMLKAEAHAARADVGLHLEYVINEGFDLGVPVQLKWSDSCFYDLRLAWDMIKFYTQQGPLSLTSGLEHLGYNPDRELENKDQERKDKERWMPLFDAAHGKRPGEVEPGRPASAPPGKGKQ
jgi:hypothetical protein